MYDMYPDWGPAKHREAAEATDAVDDGGQALGAVQAGLDLRDRGGHGAWGGQRPDDN